MRIVLLLSCLLMSATSWADIAVVVSKNSTIHSLNEKDVANIFLARTKLFPNGETAIPIEVSQNSVREAFYEHIANKTPNQLNAYWTTLVFTGKGRPPRSVESEQVLMQNLQQQPACVSYIQINQVTDDMRIVYRIAASY